jgi:predicted nucleic acid-binding protein
LIAIDTSSFIRYFEDIVAEDTAAVEDALAARRAVIVPVVLVEIFSRPVAPEDPRTLVWSLPVLEIEPGFWHRAARLRADLAGRKLKAKFADCLIAQCCIDHGIPLVTYDHDFRHFVGAGLQLL